MAYGVQLFDENGNEMINRIVPTFIVDNIISPASGSRSYPAPPEGKQLLAFTDNYISQDVFQDPLSPATVSVSGNTVTWNGASDRQPIMVVYK